MTQQRCNQAIGPLNTSGIKGVSWDRTREKWVVQVRAGDQKFSGRFATKHEAESAARAARERLHGEFANHGEMEVH